MPFYLAAGPNLQVETSSDQATQWFTKVLLHERTDDGPILPQSTPSNSSWFETDQVQSVIGILARAPLPKHFNPVNDGPRITEILFYAIKARVNGPPHLPTPPPSSPTTQTASNSGSSSLTAVPSSHDPDSIILCALPLSSDLRYQPSQYSETDFNGHADGHAYFLPSLQERVQRSQLTRKRDRLDGLFEGAPDRRKKAKRLRMESLVSQSDSHSAYPQKAMFAEGGVVVKTEDRGEGDVLASAGAAEARPRQRSRKLSRSPSVVETATRPASSTGPPMLKRSSLSQLTTSETLEDTSVEARNKAAMSRIVLAGMRMFGLQQQRKRGKRTVSIGSASELLQLQTHSQPTGHDANDDEFKGVYHQAYKGTLFAFRKRVANVVLAPESIRDVVDRLLLVFCNEPP